MPETGVSGWFDYPHGELLDKGKQLKRDTLCFLVFFFNCDLQSTPKLVGTAIVQVFLIFHLIKTRQFEETDGLVCLLHFFLSVQGTHVKMPILNDNVSCEMRDFKFFDSVFC